MRSTENVRGEWDELGERDTRVMLPGPGVGEGRGQVSGEVPPLTPARTYDAGVPGPGTEPEAGPEPETESAQAPVGEPAAAVVESPDVEQAPRKVEDEGIPADLGPALDAVAGVNPAPRPEAQTPWLDLGLDPDLDLDPVLVRASSEPVDPDPDLDLPPDLDLTPGLAPGLDLTPGLAPGLTSGPGLTPDPTLGRSPAPDLVPNPDRGPAPALTPDPAWAIGSELPGPEPVTGLRPVLEPAVAVVTRAPAREHPEAADGMDSGAATRAETEPPAAAGSGTESETEHTPVGRGSAPAGGQPEFRKPGPDGVRPPVGEATVAVGTVDPVAWWGAGRRRPVITTETTAPIPLHLLFREDGHGGGPAGAGGAAAGPGAVRSGAPRPPSPRSPRAQDPARPAPLADPRLAERPGPVLPGWAAVLTAAAGAAAGIGVLWWQGAVPAGVTARLGLGARPYDGIGTGAWALLGLTAAVMLLALCGLGRGRSGHASVLTLFGGYRGSVRRTGLLWISPLLRRRRVDVRLRHWRSEPLRAVDANGTALRAVVLVVWRVKDTVRATLGVADHERYLRDQVEAALARVLSQLPADAFHEDTHTLRDAEAVGDALTRMVRADCVPVGIEVYSAQPTGIEYAPEVAAAMQRCRVAAIDAKHRDGVLTSLVDAVDDTVGRLTARGIVELDAYEHKALVRDLTVAFYTGRSQGEGA